MSARRGGPGRPQNQQGGQTGPPARTALGARPLAGGRCAFEVWAPAAREVVLALGDPAERWVPLEPVGGGYHRAEVGACPPGTRYRFVLDGGPALADPASRSQPDGVHGPSAVVDTAAHAWKDDGFVAPPLWAHVLYEIHIGTFTAAGTFDGAVPFLDELVELGVTAVEPMPVAQCPGRRNWGYDGVFPGAVQHSYGGPAAFQRFVDACHVRSLAVVLDVVYNHLGPEGNVLSDYGPYVTDRYRTPWGDALNFDGPGSDEVRRYFTENALGWFEDFHVDALRLDAVHGIVDPTAVPFLAELADAAAELGERLGRSCLLIAESADNNPAVVAPRALGGLGMDGQWNDDFHHAVHAVLTGERTGYYGDYGRVDQVTSAVAESFVLQGGYSPFRGRRHGASPGNLEPWRFVQFVQNHDQVGNRPRGDRLAATVPFEVLRAAAALLLVSPGVPLLFMGEEYGETAPFPYFVDHGDPALVEAVRAGRADEFAGGWDGAPLDPAADATFASAVLDRSLAGKGEHARLRALVRELLWLRRRHPALRRSARHEVSSWVTGDVVTVRRDGPGGPVVLVVNLGRSEEAEAALPVVGGGSWSDLLVPTDVAGEAGGDGSRPDRSLPDGSSVHLDPLGFRLLEHRPAGAREVSG